MNQQYVLVGHVVYLIAHAIFLLLQLLLSAPAAVLWLALVILWKFENEIRELLKRLQSVAIGGVSATVERQAQ